MIKSAMPLEIKGFDKEKKTFVGYASAFHNLDRYCHIMSPEFWSKKTIDKFLAEGFTAGLNHDWSNPIGRPIDVQIDEYGVLVTNELDTDDPAALKVLQKIEKGIVKKMSFGFRTTSYEYLRDAEAVEEYWKSVKYKPSSSEVANAKYGALVLKAGEVFETCAVMIPVNNNANLVKNGLEDVESPNFLHSFKLLAAEMKSLSPEVVESLRDTVLFKDIVELLQTPKDIDDKSGYEEQLKAIRLKVASEHAELERSLIS